MAVPPFPITENINGNATTLPTIKTAYCSSSVPLKRIVDCHVPIILSLHMHLGVCFEPDSLGMPLTSQGISYRTFYFTSLPPYQNGLYISIQWCFRLVHSQFRQTLPSFSPYTFYRPPTYRIHHSPLNSFRFAYANYGISQPTSPSF